MPPGGLASASSLTVDTAAVDGVLHLVGHRIRDVEEGPDGSLWLLEDSNPGALIHVTPK